MTDTPVSFLSDDHFVSHDGTSVQDDLDAYLHGWVCACLNEGVQELDTMIVTAPDDLRSAIGCYDAMANAIEIMVQRIWTDVAMKRLLAG